MPYGVTQDSVSYFNDAVWTGVVRGLPLPKEYIGERLLPMRDVPSDELMFDIIQDANPMSALVRPGQESPPVDGQQFSEAWVSAYYTKIKRVLRAQDLRRLRAIGDAPNLNPAIDQMRLTAEATIRAEAIRLNAMVDARIEWFRIGALLGDINASGGDAFTDVGFRDTNALIRGSYADTRGVLAPNVDWDVVATSDPLGDLETWFKDLRYTVGEIIIPPERLWDIQRSTKVRTAFFAGTTAGVNTRDILPRSQVITLLEGEFGVRVTPYNSVYTTESGPPGAKVIAEHRFLDENKVIILPNEPVGFTGTSPAEQNNMQPGKFAWVEDPAVSGRKDPWVYQLGCGWYGYPVVQQPQRIMVATVTGND